MNLLPILAAFLIAGPGARQEPTPTTYQIAGQTVTLTWPEPSTPPAEVLNWPGFAYLGDGPRQWPVTTDWAAIRAKFEATPARSDAVKWPFKILILRDTEQLTPMGTPRRTGLEGPTYPGYLQEIARFCARVRAETRGAVEVVPFVETVEEAWRLEEDGFFLNARLTDGQYVAEDRVYRGRYLSWAYVTAGLPIENGDWVNAQTGADGLYARWTSDAHVRMAAAGWQSWAAASSDQWREAVSPNPRSAQSHEERPAVQQTLGLDPNPNPVTTPGGMSLKLVDDAEAGKRVLLVTLPGPDWPLSTTLPISGSKVDLGKSPTLRFRVKTASNVPLELSLVGDQVRQTVRLAPPLVRQDGSWQTVSVSVASRPDLQPQNVYLSLAPPKGWALQPRPAFPAEFRFDQVEFVSDPAPTAPGTSEPAEPEWTADILRDALKGDPFSRGAALNHLRKNKVEGMEAALIPIVSNLSPKVGEAALQALAMQDSTIGWETIRTTVRIGSNDWVRGVAAKLLASRKDPKVAGEIVALLANRSIQTRMMALEALAMLPGKEAGIMRMAFLQQEDPAIKLLATQSADPAEEYECRKLLWSSVNEPWDAVRLASHLKLMQSPIETYAREGAKGIKDDSRSVRIGLCREMGRERRSVYRPVLVTALSDVDPEVRREALTALSFYDEPVTEEEIGALRKDRHPYVLLGFLDLVSRKKVTLNEQQRGWVMTSQDPVVAKSRAVIGQ